MEYICGECNDEKLVLQPKHSQRAPAVEESTYSCIPGEI